MTNDQQLVPSDVMGRFFREAVRHHLDEAGHTASVYPAWEEIGEKLKAASTAAMSDLYDLLLAHFDRAAGAAVAKARTEASQLTTRLAEVESQRDQAWKTLDEWRVTQALLPEPRPTPGSPAAAWPPGTPVWYRRYDTGPWEQSVTKTEPWTTSNGVTWVTVEATPAQAGAALRLSRLRTLDNPPPDTELELPTTPL